jgi:hypothetical protein
VNQSQLNERWACCNVSKDALDFSKPGVKFVLLPTPDLSSMHLIIEKLPMQVLISWWSSKSFARYVAL